MCMAAWHGQKQLQELICHSAALLHRVVELFPLFPTIVLFSCPVGSNIYNKRGIFLLNSSGIYRIWDVGNNNNAYLDISFLLSVFQLLYSV